MTRGYTLVELLITISVMGLLFAAGTLSFREFSRNQAVYNSAKQVIADLRLAQQQALSGYKPVGCNGTLQRYEFTRVSATSYQVSAVCDSPVVVKSATMPGNTTITYSGAAIGFKPVAQGTSLLVPSVTITIGASDTATQQNIVISQSGDIR